MQSQDQKPKILDQVREVMRLHHYSIHTERTYIDWIRRYIAFHRMKSRDDLVEGEKKIEAFLTHLAVDERVASATQNQAMNALVFLYKRILEQPLGDREGQSLINDKIFRIRLRAANRKDFPFLFVDGLIRV
jgi:hypothetical protein